MQHHRFLSWLAVILLCAFVLVIFYLATKPPQVNTDYTETETEIIPLSEPTVTFIDPQRGSEEPKIVIVEFADFDCLPCRDMSENISALQAKLPGQISHVFKGAPNSGASPTAERNMIAAYCAHEQGRFWEYHDFLFDSYGYITDELLTIIASTIGLDTTVFNNCLTEQYSLPKIEHVVNEA
ncbi:MAG: thioredoxin domain-containing protein, partial [Candidatus Uhrbacteria bacterium]